MDFVTSGVTHMCQPFTAPTVVSSFMVYNLLTYAALRLALDCPTVFLSFGLSAADCTDTVLSSEEAEDLEATNK